MYKSMFMMGKYKRMKVGVQKWGNKGSSVVQAVES